VRKAVSTIALQVLVSVPLLAYEGVSPRESKLEASETYAVNVSSEGGRTTVAVVLDANMSKTRACLWKSPDGRGKTRIPTMVPSFPPGKPGTPIWHEICYKFSHG
jgi:hypothetical protein